MAPALPIDDVLPEIAAVLAQASRLVLVAPPGAGKTTRVPLALLDSPWLGRNKIIVLEPRRLATRAAARRMAQLLGEHVGETVGYRVHLDTVVSRHTRIEVVTEGVLTRMLQTDATLAGVSAVVFDEFHERSLHADLGLALTLQTQRVVRDDLRVIVMSATLDGHDVGRSLAAPVIHSQGVTFPVATHYRPLRDRERLDDAMVRVVREAVNQHEGDVLAFLPGGAEIRRAAERLGASIDTAAIDIRPLYGDLAADAQDAAIVRSPPGRRKIVLATNIAETSLTIDGVTVVVDSGARRAPRFSPRTGLTRLETMRVSRASADQRRGRAGRTAPGVCYRLWSEGDNAQLTPRSTPEILDADLAPLALELVVAGIADPAELTWLDAPPAGALAQGRALLEALGVIDAESRLTALGTHVASLPAHPRVATMLVNGASIGHGALACDVAALLANRDILRTAEAGARADADLRSRVDALNGREHHTAGRVDPGMLRQVRSEARMWRERLSLRAGARGDDDRDKTGLLLSFAYPDRVARRRADDTGRYLLSSGTGATFAEPQGLGEEEWLVIAETDGRVPESRIYLAAPTSYDELRQHHPGAFTTSDDIEWSDASERVVAARRTRVGAIVVHEQTLRDPDASQVFAALAGAVRRHGVTALPWGTAAAQLRARMAFVHAMDRTWPDVSDEALDATLEGWLAPVLAGAQSMKDVTRADLAGALLSLLDWRQRSQLNALAPAEFVVPTGSSIRIDYTDPSAPALAVRLQELYGLAETPTVAGGRVPLTLHLLSPAQRPVQVTRDLGAFWRGSYADVRKEMRGRYPKHDWPDDPAHALPSRGRKRR